MMIRASELLGAGLQATDGAIGKIVEGYFDEETWDVRYVVVDTGKWLPGRKVLLIPKVLGEFHPGQPAIPVDLNKDQIKDSPPMEAAEPVSALAEQLLHAHYGWVPYWTDPISPPPPPLLSHGREARAEAEKQAQRLHLRGIKEVKGYHVLASNGEFGHVEDLVIGDRWKVTGLVVDTSNLPGGKLVVAPVNWVSNISWADSRVVVSVPRQQLQEAPVLAAIGVES